jgi:hypothetical protein
MMFYLTHADDEATQKKGCIGVSIHLGGFRFTSTIVREAKIFARLSHDGAVRFSGQHNLLGENNVGFGQIVNMYLQLADKETRARFKCHYGMYTIGMANSR